MRTKKLEIITCPNCGREYLPSEIYIPNSFFNDPGTIIRDSDGKIDTFTGNSINEKEHYTCDNCGIDFDVTAKITFTCKKSKDFEEESVTIISQNLIFNED